MEIRGLQPDAFAYNVLLSALSEAGRPEEAQNMLHKLAESGKLSEKFSSLMKPSVEGTETGTENEGKSGTEPCKKAEDNAAEEYKKRVNELCTGGQLKEAKAVLDEMMQKGFVLPSLPTDLSLRQEML
jgi:pentatricopeptide repeat protein